MDRSGLHVLQGLHQKIKKEFDANQRVLTFEEYLHLIAENPERHLRGSAQYIVGMFEHYGKEPIKGTDDFRFGLFDFPIDGIASRLVGHEEVQTHIYRTLRSFSQLKMNNRLILLHGPNGSAKTTIAHGIMGAMEQYSHTPEGAIYTFNWVFPLERYTKGGIGLQASYSPKEDVNSYARLPEEEIAIKIPSELRDHPFLLIPREHRRTILREILGESKGEQIWNRLPIYLTEGDLCQRSKEIFEALLTAHRGDYKKVLTHIQIERFYYSRRYRKGLSTIEPQLHVDAQYQLLTFNKNIGNLPASLQSLNLFTLNGDLIEGNRGMIEYSDLLKRPIDSFKYLLGLCETGSVNVGSTTAHLDTIMLGSTNELQLDAFKEFPDFSSFKARIELVRTPYLLSVTQEKEIYNALIPQMSGEKPVCPETDWAIALWAVLTRLKKPNAINYPPSISNVISSLTPLDKAKLYDTGEMPSYLSPEDRKLLRSNIRKLKEEYVNIPYYEGRIGASAREVKTILFDAIQNPEYKTLSPIPLFKALEEFVKKISEYEFLKQDVKDRYHDAVEFIDVVRNEYLARIDRQIRDCIGLYDSQQWEDFIKKYVIHVSSLLRKEKIKNAITGKQEDPDKSLIEEFEKIVQAPQDTTELGHFRNNMITQIGAWKLDHPNENVVYSKVFPEHWSKLEKHYYESQKAVLKKMHDALVVYGTDQDDRSSEGSRLARQTIENMKSRLGYTEDGAKEVINFLMRKRYS